MTALQRAAIVAEARRWIGTPYMHQASLIHAGCDCLGLLRGVWRALAGQEPQAPGPYTPDWAEAGGEERLLRAARLHCIETEDWSAGDILLFRWRPNLSAKHVGIATSRDRMVHAHEGACVCEVAINKYWRSRIAGAFSFPQFD